MAVFALLPRSLRFRMAGVVVMLVLIATMVVTWVALVLAERDMKGIIGNQQFALLSAVAAQLDAQISAKKLLLASLADTVPADAGLDAAHMKAFADRHPVVRKEFVNLHIYNRRGVLFNTSGDHAAPLEINERIRAYLDRALAAGKPVVSPPFTGQDRLHLHHDHARDSGAASESQAPAAAHQRPPRLQPCH